MGWKDMHMHTQACLVLQVNRIKKDGNYLSLEEKKVIERKIGERGEVIEEEGD